MTLCPVEHNKMSTSAVAQPVPVPVPPPAPVFLDVEDAANDLASLSISPATTSNLKFTDEEISAFRAVRAKLDSLSDCKGKEAITDREIVAFTLISKLRVDKTIERCKDFIDVLQKYGIDYRATHPEFDDFSLSPEQRKFFRAYRVAGRDKRGRGIMWIEGNEEGVQPKDEALVVTIGIMYYLAVHCHDDLLSLREGITFVIDTSKNPAKPVGNERKLQKRGSRCLYDPKTFS